MLKEKTPSCICNKDQMPNTARTRHLKNKKQNWTEAIFSKSFNPGKQAIKNLYQKFHKKSHNILFYIFF